MWLAWLFIALIAILEGHYLTRNSPGLNSFAKRFDLFAALMLVIPAIICAALRFWLSRFRNLWLALLPFLIGLFFAWQVELYGIFLFPQFYIVFQILSGVLFASYLPLFVRLRPVAPTNEPTKA